MKLLVTAGPTREALDPVRFLSNRSSGKMGFAIAEVAAERGHRVCLVAGPVSLDAPGGVERININSAEEMCRAVVDRFSDCDALVMAAAVADWRPKRIARHKLKKGTMSPVIELERTPDILKTIAASKRGQIVVGFAAETDSPEEEALRKLTEKRLDLIAVNDVSRSDAGFEVDTNEVILLAPGGWRKALPLLSKRTVAEQIVTWIERRHDGETPQRP